MIMLLTHLKYIFLFFSSSSATWTTAPGSSPCWSSTQSWTPSLGFLAKFTTYFSCHTASCRSHCSSQRNISQSCPTHTLESFSFSDHGSCGGLWLKWFLHRHLERAGKSSRRSPSQLKKAKSQSNKSSVPKCITEKKIAASKLSLCKRCEWPLQKMPVMFSALQYSQI